MLSRQYYQRVAAVLERAVRLCNEVDDQETVVFLSGQVISPLAVCFWQDNPRFDHKRFMSACGVGQEEKQ